MVVSSIRRFVHVACRSVRVLVGSVLFLYHMSAPCVILVIFLQVSLFVLSKAAPEIFDLLFYFLHVFTTQTPDREGSKDTDIYHTTQLWTLSIA
jgi:hypothetical protein